MTETEEQKEIVKWFRETYPQYAMSLRVSQSGGHRGKGRAAAMRLAKDRAMGAVKGEADIAILVPNGRFGALLIEHKAEGGYYKPTAAQQAYLHYHNGIGNCAVSTKGIEAAKAAIIAYLEEI